MGSMHAIIVENDQTELYLFNLIYLCDALVTYMTEYYLISIWDCQTYKNCTNDPHKFFKPSVQKQPF